MGQIKKMIYTKVLDHHRVLQKLKCVLKSRDGHIGFYSNDGNGDEVCYVIVNPNTNELSKTVGRIEVKTQEEADKLINYDPNS